MPEPIAPSSFESSPSDQRRSIAFYSPGWPPGRVSNGIVTYVGAMQTAMQDLGIETSVVTPLQVGPDSLPAIDLSRLRRSGLRRVFPRVFGRFPRYLPWGFPLGWSVAEAISEMSANRRLDLIEMEETFGAAWFTQQIVEIPVVVRLHGPHFLNGVALGLDVDDEFRRIDVDERRCIAAAVGLTSPSRDVLAQVRDRYDIPLVDAQVIPNPAPIVPPERRWSLERSDRKTILFVGRFDRHKAGDLIIDAFAEVATMVPHAELIFVGPDRGLRDESGRVHSLPDYLSSRLSPSVRARVQVTGAVDAERISQLRQGAYLTVVPSRYENFPLALVESLAYGCPTIGSDAGGIPEILLDGRTGLLFRSGDRSDLVSKLVELFEHPERAATLGGRASADMALRLNPEAIARSTLEYYEGVLARGKRRTSGLSAARTMFFLTGVGGRRGAT